MSRLAEAGHLQARCFGGWSEYRCVSRFSLFVKLLFRRLVNPVSRVLILFVSFCAQAEDTLSTVMARMKPETTVRLSYRETRQLELLDQPWLGQGYLYALPPHVMVREQTQPDRVIAGADSNGMFYLEPDNNRLYRKSYNDDDPLTLNIIVFRALINGDGDLLVRYFQIDFFSGLEYWQLTLTPKNDKARENLARVIISGQPEQPADKIILQQQDGDASEFVLAEKATGQKVAREAEELYRQLQGR